MLSSGLFGTFVYDPRVVVVIAETFHRWLQMKSISVSEAFSFALQCTVQAIILVSRWTSSAGIAVPKSTKNRRDLKPDIVSVPMRGNTVAFSRVSYLQIPLTYRS